MLVRICFTGQCTDIHGSMVLWCTVDTNNFEQLHTYIQYHTYHNAELLPYYTHAQWCYILWCWNVYACTQLSAVCEWLVRNVCGCSYVNGIAYCILITTYCLRIHAAGVEIVLLCKYIFSRIHFSMVLAWHIHYWHTYGTSQPFWYSWQSPLHISSCINYMHLWITLSCML